MEISCDIIRDLLPLYAEDLVSDASREMVDEHLCACDSCTKQLGILKKAMPVPVEVNTASLKRVGDTIRRRRILTATAVLLTAVSLIITVLVILTTPYLLTAAEAIEEVWITEDGALVIDYARGVTGKASQSILDEKNNARVCTTTRYDWYIGRQKDAMLESMTKEAIENHIAELYGKDICTEDDWNRFFDIDYDYGLFLTKDGVYFHNYDPEVWTKENGEWSNRPTDRNQWYIHPTFAGLDMHMMYDAELDVPTGALWDTSLGYAYLLFGSVAMAGICWWFSGSSAGIRKGLLCRMAILFVCVSVSTLLVTSGQLRTLGHYLSYEWNQAICTETVMLTLTAMVWYGLHEMKGL